MAKSIQRSGQQQFNPLLQNDANYKQLFRHIHELNTKFDVLQDKFIELKAYVDSKFSSGFVLVDTPPSSTEPIQPVQQVEPEITTPPTEIAHQIVQLESPQNIVENHIPVVIPDEESNDTVVEADDDELSVNTADALTAADLDCINVFPCSHKCDKNCLKEKLKQQKKEQKRKEEEARKQAKQLKKTLEKQMKSDPNIVKFVDGALKIYKETV